MRPVVRLAPGLNSVLLNRFRAIWNDEVHVEFDNVAEAVTRRAGAERAVKREQPRLWNLVGDTARAALKLLAEPMYFLSTGVGLATSVDFDRERSPIAFQIRSFDRIG